MDDNTTEMLSTDIFQLPDKRRKQLLPWWIKGFCWLFLLLGIAAPFGLVFGILGKEFALSVYGLDTNKPLSILGIVILSIFALKGLTAYGLLNEKNWAIKLGITDAIIGTAICLYSMLSPLIGQNASQNFTFRLEIVLLIPFLLYLLKIKSDWENAAQV